MLHSGSLDAGHRHADVLIPMCNVFMGETAQQSDKNLVKCKPEIEARVPFGFAHLCNIIDRTSYVQGLK